MAAKVIIGIHGLRNKPPRELLIEWWKQSIDEGFRVLNKPVPKYELDMAYWAHFIHPEPQDPGINDPGHPLYLDEHYEPGAYFGPREPRSYLNSLWNLSKKHFLLFTVGRPNLRFHFPISDIILRTMFRELDIYYHESLTGPDGKRHPAKDLIRDTLTEKLRQHKGKEIMIVAHSMGAIVTYDVLRDIPAPLNPQCLVTLGAPLGFPVVVKKILESHLGGWLLMKKPRTPEALRQFWLNLSDWEDVTAIKYNLRNIYTPNSRGVRSFDKLVDNNYESQGRLNPHKSYGYLRTADFTRAVEDFLRTKYSQA